MTGRGRSGAGRVGWSAMAVLRAKPWLVAELEREPSVRECALLEAAWIEHDALRLLLGAAGQPDGPSTRDAIEVEGTTLFGETGSIPGGDHGAAVAELLGCVAAVAARGGRAVAIVLSVRAPHDGVSAPSAMGSFAATASELGLPIVAGELRSDLSAESPVRLDFLVLGQRTPGSPGAAGDSGLALQDGALLGLLSVEGEGGPGGGPPVDPGAWESFASALARRRRACAAVRAAVLDGVLCVRAVWGRRDPLLRVRELLRVAGGRLSIRGTGRSGEGPPGEVCWVAVVGAGDLDEVRGRLAAAGVGWSAIGELSSSGAPRVEWTDPEPERAVLTAALVDGPPHGVFPAVDPGPDLTGGDSRAADMADPVDYEASLLRVAAFSLGSAGEPGLESIDWLAGGRTWAPPGGDAGVVRGSVGDLALVLKADSCPRYEAADPYVGACIAGAEAARNLVATGATPLALWAVIGLPDACPTGAELGRAQQAALGLRDAAAGLGLPVLGTRLIPRPEGAVRGPAGTTVFAVGRLVTSAPLVPWFRDAGDVVVLLGRAREEVGTSLLAALASDPRSATPGGSPPWVDLEAERQLARVVLAVAAKGILRSAHDLSDGGLAVALVEACAGDPVAGAGLGARLRLEEGMGPAAWLFGESQARMLVSVRRGDLAALREEAREGAVQLAVVGEVGGDVLEVADLLSVPVTTLRELRGRRWSWSDLAPADGAAVEKPPWPG